MSHTNVIASLEKVQHTKPNERALLYTTQWTLSPNWLSFVILTSLQFYRNPSKGLFVLAPWDPAQSNSWAHLASALLTLAMFTVCSSTQYFELSPGVSSFCIFSLTIIFACHLSLSCVLSVSKRHRQLWIIVVVILTVGYKKMAGFFKGCNAECFDLKIYIC